MERADFYRINFDHHLIKSRINFGSKIVICKLKTSSKEVPCNIILCRNEKVLLCTGTVFYFTTEEMPEGRGTVWNHRISLCWLSVLWFCMSRSLKKKNSKIRLSKNLGRPPPAPHNFPGMIRLQLGCHFEVLTVVRLRDLSVYLSELSSGNGTFFAPSTIPPPEKPILPLALPTSEETNLSFKP